MDRRMSRGRRLFYGLVAATLIAVVVLFYRRTEAGDTLPVEATPWVASGVIRAKRVSIASELGGRIAAVPVREGAMVTQGAVVAELDPTLLEGQIAVARSGVSVAQAGLERALAGAGPG